jgi:hypothetical protein
MEMAEKHSERLLKKERRRMEDRDEDRTVDRSKTKPLLSFVASILMYNTIREF